MNVGLDLDPNRLIVCSVSIPEFFYCVFFKQKHEKKYRACKELTWIHCKSKTIRIKK